MCEFFNIGWPAAIAISAIALDLAAIFVALLKSVCDVRP